MLVLSDVGLADKSAVIVCQIRHSRGSGELGDSRDLILRVGFSGLGARDWEILGMYSTSWGGEGVLGLFPEGSSVWLR